MKVKELMEILARYGEDAEVEVEGGYCEDGLDGGFLYVDHELILEEYRGVC